METHKHYFLVGSFVIATIVAALLFTVWLSSEGDGKFKRYQIRFAESVSGLSVSGTVKFRGVNVGTVESIVIDPNDTQLIKVVIKVAESTPIKIDTVASLKMQGITGVVFIELSGGNSKMALEDASNDKIPEIRAQSSAITAVLDKLPEILDRVSKSVAQINKLFSDENIGALSSAIQQFSVSMEQLQPMLQNGNQVTKDLRDITQGSKGSINETMGNLSRSSQQLESLLRDLKKTTRHISGLAEDLDDDPSRLIFPAKDKGVKAP